MATSLTEASDIRVHVCCHANGFGNISGSFSYVIKTIVNHFTTLNSAELFQTESKQIALYSQVASSLLRSNH